MDTRKIKLAAAFLFAFAALGTARSQAEDKPTVKSKASEVKAENPHDGPRVALRIDNAQRLRQMMEEKLKLSPQQSSAINRVFDDYIGDLRNNYNKKRDDRTERPDNKVLPPTIKQMERERASAESIGDKNRAEELNREISNRRREPVLQGDSHIDSLRAKIVEHLKDSQVAEFDKLLDRWKAIVPRGPRTGPFQRLRRALKDPEVGISAEKDKEFDEILTESLKSGRTGKEGSREQIGQEVEKAKTKIFAQLTPDQRKKVDANLRMFEQVEKQYDDSIDRAKAKGVFKKKAETKASANPAPPPAPTAPAAPVSEYQPAVKEKEKPAGETAPTKEGEQPAAPPKP